MQVYDLLRHNQAFASATVSNDGLPELCVPDLQRPCEVKQTTDKTDLASTKARVDLLDLLPASRRVEAQAIIDRDPSMIDYLRECKRGVIDAWVCMELMGMDPWE